MQKEIKKEEANYNCVAYSLKLNSKPLTLDQAHDYKNSCIINYGCAPEIVPVENNNVLPPEYKTLKIRRTAIWIPYQFFQIAKPCDARNRSPLGETLPQR